jgi:hypothetical protein
MRFARRVFYIAGIWGLLIVTPLYFMYDRIGRDYPPPLTHPDVYYGFVGVTLVWQVAFLIIGSDPVRFRPLMIAAVLEKFTYMITLTTLYVQGRLPLEQYAIVSPDAILCVLFAVAFVKTPREAVAKLSPVGSNR